MKDEIIEKYPDALQEITESLVLSGLFIEEEPESATVIGASFLGQDPSVIAPLLSNPGGRVATGRLFPVK